MTKKKQPLTSEEIINSFPPKVQKSDIPPVVALGGSAGGLDAFKEFFTNMPEKSGIAFIVIAHLDPVHVSILPELLQKCTKIKTQHVIDGVKVEADNVYVIPPDKELAILNGNLQLFNRGKPQGFNLPIDSFLRSLAKDQADNAVCIILSGTGTDGTLGLKEIKNAMGMVMAQDEISAKYSGMPRSAAETGLVDYILSPEKMPEQLIKYLKQPTCRLRGNTGIIHDKASSSLQKAIATIRSHTGHDFSMYKPNTIYRRIERRMNVHHIKDIKDYVRYLRESQNENIVLFNELLIGVTNFFRDPESFGILKEKVFPQMIADKHRDYSLRIWVPGCSTGEEAYSIAICLKEVMEQTKQYVNVQIFGTDIDKSAISKARAGLYPESISNHVGSVRLNRFFTKEDGWYRISKSIREMIVFAPQNIIKDPPFTKLDMLSCRNLLIYLNAEVQKKILPLFSYTLRSGGVLMLGSSETIGGFTDMFTPIDKKWKIFTVKKLAPLKYIPMTFSAEEHQPVGVKKVTERRSEKVQDIDISRYVKKSLLEIYAPTAVVINKNAEVVFIYGRTGKYLEPAAGRASLSILNMAREGIRFELTDGIRKVISTDQKVRFENLEIKVNDTVQYINININPVRDSKAGKGLMIVTFEDVPLISSKEIGTKINLSEETRDRHLRVLEQELKYTKENLQTTVEELETSNEEMKSSNEELQSTNEELQSSNEELETSKEELQSLNEELSTVNCELQGRIDTLTHTTNDMKNLLDSINIATIFLDTELRVRRFTPKATDIINLIQSDIGRDISHIALKIAYDKLVTNAKQVLKTLVPIESEVQDDVGNSYISKILPYRTVENKIDGIVIIFDNITKAKKTGSI